MSEQPQDSAVFTTPTPRPIQEDPANLDETNRHLTDRFNQRVELDEKGQIKQQQDDEQAKQEEPAAPTRKTTRRSE